MIQEVSQLKIDNVTIGRVIKNMPWKNTKIDYTTEIIGRIETARAAFIRMKSDISILDIVLINVFISPIHLLQE